MSDALAPEILESLHQLDTCSISNAVETFQVRLRNEGFTDPSVHCLFPQLGRMVGYAVPVRVRCSSPPPDGHPYLDRTDWWNYLLTVPGPRVVVIEDVDHYTGHGAFVGELHAMILRALGCVGAVTNGSVRDLPAVERSGFHLFAATVCVSHSFVHIVDFESPVLVGGLQVRSGDLLVGDGHGIISVPKEIASQIPSAAARLRSKELDVLEYCRSDHFSVQGLRDRVKDVL